jgi:F-type H+-transporting ATPase subunit epsilon
VIKLNNKYLSFKLITPDGILVDDKVTKVKAFTSLGGLTVLPNHTELKSDLVEGTLKYTLSDGKTFVKYRIGTGVIEIGPDFVKIITSFAKEKEENPIDKL